ncbi:MAG TPA: nitrite reductase (NAD(P)H) small subunit [Candidatus Omnitrophica bacterium]|nr:nitrite reductase (NAD(P)H) small subunit [Candidatus Omnitrophota bacterium]
MINWVRVAASKDVPTNTGLAVEVEDQAVALYKVDGQVYAIEGVCPHAGGPLAEGSLNGCLAMCPWHGWEFDVKTGKCDFNPEIAVKTYPVKEEKGEIFIKI